MQDAFDFAPFAGASISFCPEFLHLFVFFHLAGGGCVLREYLDPFWSLPVFSLSLERSYISSLP